jgi:hypothetical protein
MSKRKTLAIVAAVAAFAAVSASATTLGGLTGASLGADTKVVASCDTVGGVSVGYTTVYNNTAGVKQYTVTSVKLGNLDAGCDLKAAEVTLSDGAGVLGTYTLASIPTGGNALVPLTSAPVVLANAVTNVAVVISG